MENKSVTMLSANSTNVVLSYVERISKSGQSLSTVAYALQHPCMHHGLHGLMCKNAPVSIGTVT